MDKRELTGAWYLKKRFFGGYHIMVEVRLQIWYDPSYGNGEGCYAPEVILFEKAKREDIYKLNIKVV